MLAMSLYKYFHAEKQLLTVKDAGISKSFTAGANAVVVELVHERSKKKEAVHCVLGGTASGYRQVCH